MTGVGDTPLPASPIVRVIACETFGEGFDRTFQHFHFLVSVSEHLKVCLRNVPLFLSLLESRDAA